MAREAALNAESVQDSAALQRIAELLEETACAPLTLHVVGYSFGCRIAFGVAELLQAEGHSVCLMLIDGPMGGPIGSLEQAILNSKPQSIPGRLVKLLTAGGEAQVEDDVAVDLYVASDAEVGLDTLQEWRPNVKVVHVGGSHQEVLRAPTVAAVATSLAQAAALPHD